MVDSLDGRLAVVTGAAGDIGRELCRQLAAAGASLVLLDIDREGLEATRQALGGADAALYVVDVTDWPAVEATAATIVESHGVPTLLVNSVGYLGPHDALAVEATHAQWTRVFAITFFGPVAVTRAFVPLMHAAGRPAHVLNLASLAGLISGTRVAPYYAAKHALVSFSEGLSDELAAMDSAVGVSIVCPGPVTTQMNETVRAALGSTDASPEGYLTPADVVPPMLDAVRTGRLYVFTHAGSRERIEGHHQRLVADLT